MKSSDSKREVRGFRISGMDCAEEIALLKREVGPLVGGGDRLGFDLLRGRMTVPEARAAVPDELVLNAVRRAGLTAEPWQETGSSQASRRLRRRRFASTLVAGVATVSGLVAHGVVAGGLAQALGSEGLGGGHAVPLVARAIYALGIAAGLFTVAPKAWQAVRRRRGERWVTGAPRSLRRPSGPSGQPASLS